MSTSDLQWFVLGMVVPLVFRLVIAWAEASTMAKETIERIEEYVPQPNPEVAFDYTQREARRVERPLEERGVPGFVVREVNIDHAHRIINAKPGSITVLDGARAE